MKLVRLHSFLIACLVSAVLPISMAWAEEYPDRPIHILIPASPGGAADSLARIMVNDLTRLLGQPIIIDNVPGGGGMIALKKAVAAKPDGYTLVLYWSDLLGTTPYTFKEQPFDPIQDLTQVAAVSQSGGVILAVPPNSPVKSFQDFVFLARSTPKQLSFGTWGIGSSAQIGFEVLNSKLGVQMVHIPFNGSGPSYRAAMSGEIDVVPGVAFAPLLKAGKLRPIAIGGNSRSNDFPAIPTLAELGMGNQIFAPVYYGLAGPAKIPKPIVDRLNKALVEWTKIKGIVEPLNSIGQEPRFFSPDEVAEKINSAVALNVPVIKRLGLNSQ